MQLLTHVNNTGSFTRNTSALLVALLHNAAVGYGHTNSTPVVAESYLYDVHKGDYSTCQGGDCTFSVLLAGYRNRLASLA